MQDMKNWSKCCFELTDFDTPTAVSVVTMNGQLDDANGCNIDGQNSVWLKICQAGNAYSFHYLQDGKKFDMTRYFMLSNISIIKMGLLAQAPTENGGDIIYEHISIESRTVKNIQMGE